MPTIDSSDKHDKTFERLVRQEEIILNVTNCLTEALEHAGVTKAELAKRIERSPGFVSHIFGGGRNLTLRTISDIAAALSLQPTLQLKPDRKSGIVDGEWSIRLRPPSVQQKIELSPASYFASDDVIQVA